MDRLAAALGTTGLVVAAVTVRLLPLLECGPTCRPIAIDEGTYFTSGALLGRGYVPYRDYFLAHPPGIALVIGPLTAWATPRVGFGIVTAVLATFGAASIVLATVITRRVAGTVAGLVAGALLAVSPNVTLTDRTVGIGPLLTCCSLLTMWAWCRRADLVRGAPTGHAGAAHPDDRRADRRADRLALATGAALGLALVTKTWALMLIPALAATMPRTDRRRALPRLGAGALCVLAPAILPFLVVAPAEFVRDVGFQVTRDSEGGAILGAERLRVLLGLTPNSLSEYPMWPLLVGLALAAATFATVRSARTPALRFSLVWCATTVLALLLTPVFFGDYVVALEAPGALAIGLSCGTWIDLVRADPRRVVRAAAGVMLAAVAVHGLDAERYSLAQAQVNREPAWDDFRARVAGRRPCTFGIDLPTEGGEDRQAWLIAIDMVSTPSRGEDVPTLLRRGTSPDDGRRTALRRCASIIGWPDEMARLGVDARWLGDHYRRLPRSSPANISPAPVVWVRRS